MIGKGFYQTLASPWLWGILVLAACLPLALNSYHLHLLTLALVYVALASAWNIVGGMAGQVSLAHSLFIGIGAMLSTALLVKFGINMPVAPPPAPTPTAAEPASPSPGAPAADDESRPDNVRNISGSR